MDRNLDVLHCQKAISYCKKYLFVLVVEFIAKVRKWHYQGLTDSKAITINYAVNKNTWNEEKWSFALKFLQKVQREGEKSCIEKL